MKKSVADHLLKLCEEASDIDSTYALERWSSKASTFLAAAMGLNARDEFLQLKDADHWIEHALRLGHLEGLVAKSQVDEITSPPHFSRGPVAAINSRKVFVVHGHDDETKVKIARFLEKLGLTPIILHEQPSSGRTIIEKFETYSDDIAFAVVLLTPDDVGEAASNANYLKPRARQNVVMELGYFMGRLGRARVCALHKGMVELPSDYQGVLYIELDTPGAWQARLAQELVQAQLPIDLRGLLGG